MSQIHDLKLKVERLIAERHLDPVETKGKISLRCGVVFALITERTPDDPAKIERLRAAVRAVLGAE